MPSVSANKEKEEEECHVVGRSRGKSRKAGPQSCEPPRAKNTYICFSSSSSNGDAPSSYGNIAYEVQKINQTLWWKIEKAKRIFGIQVG